MGRIKDRENDFMYNVIRLESLLTKPSCNLEGTFIMMDDLYSKSVAPGSIDITKLINAFPTFQNTIGSNADNSFRWSVCIASKEIPKSIKRNFKYVPRDTVQFVINDFDPSGKFSEGLRLLYTVDNFGKIVILNSDKRVAKHHVQLPDEYKSLLEENFIAYFTTLHKFYLSDYCILYDYKKCKVIFPLLGDDVKELFRDRDKDSSGRRQPLVYGVDEYTNSKGTIYRGHLRGYSDFTFKGRQFKLLVGQAKWKEYALTMELMESLSIKAKY